MWRMGFRKGRAVSPARSGLVFEASRVMVLMHDMPCVSQLTLTLHVSGRVTCSSSMNSRRHPTRSSSLYPAAITTQVCWKKATSKLSATSSRPSLRSIRPHHPRRATCDYETWCGWSMLVPSAPRMPREAHSVIIRNSDLDESDEYAAQGWPRPPAFPNIMCARNCAWIKIPQLYCLVIYRPSDQPTQCFWAAKMCVRSSHSFSRFGSVLPLSMRSVSRPTYAVSKYKHQ